MPTIHPKKLLLKIMVLAVLGLIVGLTGGGLPAASAIPGSTVVSVRIRSTDPQVLFDVDQPVANQSGGRTIEVVFSGANVSTVEVFIDGASTPFATITIDMADSFGPQSFGQITLPSGVAAGDHTLLFLAHPKEDDDLLSPVAVERNITVSPDAPQIDSVNPLTVSTAGGDVITITGQNFSGATAVTVGGQPCLSFNIINSTTIHCTVPARLAGYADVTVTTPQGTYTKRRAILYVEPSQILPPETGVFRLGDQIVTTYDMVWLVGLLAVAGGVAFWLKKRYTKQCK